MRKWYPSQAIELLCNSWNPCRLFATPLGEGLRPSDGGCPPHPNPLPGGERERGGDCRISPVSQQLAVQGGLALPVGEVARIGVPLVVPKFQIRGDDILPERRREHVRPLKRAQRIEEI